MAELPVEQTRGGAPRLEIPGADFLRGATALPAVRQGGLLFALAASVAVGFSVVLWMQEPDYRPVVSIADSRQAGDAAQLLDTAGIEYRIDDNAGLLLVPRESYYAAKMQISGAGIADDTQRGYEILEGDNGFGVSQFMEQAKFRQSLEGELARSIATMDAVQRARVHLAIPKSTTFLRDRRAPTASVKVVLRGSAALKDDQVRGIKNLVSHAVAELKPDDVSVVDQSGRLLSAADSDELADETNRQLKVARRIEASLQDKVRNILLPTVGANRFSAEVSADIDFTAVEQTEELFNPDLPAVRSETTLDEEKVGEIAEGGIPGALSNQPPGPVTAPELIEEAALAPGTEPSRSSRSQATRNYEIDRTISYTRHGVGRIERLTVSVVVDDLPMVGEDGTTTREPWPEQRLERLTRLVENAVGFDAARGDLVTVVNAPFIAEQMEAALATPIWAETWFLDLVKKVLGGLALVLLILGLLRPMFKSLSKAGEAETQARVAEGSLLMAPAAEQPLRLPDPGTVAFLPTPEEIRDSVETVRTIVADNPGRAAAVVKDWVASDE